jgi:ATP-dependent RNA helicase RhlE
MPPEIAGLADNILVDPVKVAVTPVSSTAELIEQLVYFVDKNKKRYLLLDLLKDPAITSALVFTRTKHGANRVAGDLSKAGIRAEAIHGNKSQTARQNALNNFKNKKTRVLVATDIAARGIDLEELSHVINYELPNVPETYVHRIGRTGRAGASGIAFSFCDQEEMPFLRDIQRLIGKKVPVAHNDTFDLNIPAPDVPLPAAERPARPQHQQGRQKQQPNQQQPRKGNQRQQNRAGKAGQEQAQGDQRQQKRQGQENPSKTQQQTQPHHLPKPKNMSPKPHHKHQPDKPQPDQKAYDSRHSDRSAQNRRQPSGQSRQPDNRGREQQPNRRPQQEEKYSENQGVETAPKKEQQPVAAKSSVFQKPSDPNAKKGFVIRTEPSPTWKKKPSAQNFRGKFNQKKGR